MGSEVVLDPGTYPVVAAHLGVGAPAGEPGGVRAVGTGKTFFLEALGQVAVEAAMKVAWFSLEDLGALVRRHRIDDSVTKRSPASCVPTW